jgi:phospholipid/cholesterol/gamma-HCH transport system substrate-binding protein
MKNSLETKLGLFVAVTLIAAWAIVETLGSVDVFGRGYHVSAQFNTIQDLKLGDRVKMAGVEIGRVEGIELTTNKVRVTMRLHKNAVVKTSSVASVKFTGLMGQNFVALDFGSPADSTLATDGTELTSAEQPDLSAIMTKLDNAAGGIQNITKNFAGDEIKHMFGALDDVISSKKDSIKNTLDNIENISGEIRGGKGTVGKLIYDDALYATAMDTVTNIHDTVDSIKLTIADARAGKGTIGKLLVDETLYNSATASMTNLDSILLKVNQGDGTIGKLVNDQEFYKNAKLSLQKLDKAADGLEDTGPLSVIGIMANQLGL